MNLHCWLFGHEWIREYTPGRLALRCVTCRLLTPGLRGPVSPPVVPVVMVRRLRKPKPVALKVVRPRVTRTA